MLSQLTYIWIDGAEPTHKLRCKTRIIQHPQGALTLENIPEWGFDGSSTYQATGHDSDLILKPARFVVDPILGGDNYLLLCEVMNPDGMTPHKTNTRAYLRQMMANGGADHKPWI